MSTIYNLVIVLQVLSAIAIIGLVLLQHGKGADMGAAFGSGASGSLFGASGSSNFMSKATAFSAAIFFAATLALAYMSAQRSSSTGGGVMDNAPVKTSVIPATVPAAASAPAAAPAPAAPAPAEKTPAGQIPK